MTREKVGLPTEIELDAWELTSRGVSLGTLGRYDEERDTYEEAIRVKSDYVPAWFNQAAARALGRLEEAIDYANMALHLNPASIPALINKGLALYALNRSEEAIACFDTASHIQPRDPAVWSGRVLRSCLAKGMSKGPGWRRTNFTASGPKGVRLSSRSAQPARKWRLRQTS